MEDYQLLDAAERYIRGEMQPEEKVQFEELRKTNPEIDHLVVEHTIFLSQFEKFGERKNFKSLLNDVHNNLSESGSIKEEMPKAKLI